MVGGGGESRRISALAGTGVAWICGASRTTLPACCRAAGHRRARGAEGVWASAGNKNELSCDPCLFGF